MFTGLVETMGRVLATFDQPPTRTLRIALTPPVCDGVQIGDSICISGCCLTVVKIGGGDEPSNPAWADFEAGGETLSRTNLGRLASGDNVNLERSLAVGDRMGGHYVSGHVDALSKIIAIEPDPPWAKYWFAVKPEHARQIAAKGSITVDGISLTVVDATADRFSVALIPHTLSVTTLGGRKVGDEVNLETDVLAKYIERQLQERLPWPNDKPAAT